MKIVRLFIYRAGWPATGTPVRNKYWLRIGPYVIGNTSAWDRGGNG